MHTQKEVRKTCTRPLIRAETWETYINKKGGKSYKIEWLGRDFYDEIRNSPNWNYWNGTNTEELTQYLAEIAPNAD